LDKVGGLDVFIQGTRFELTNPNPDQLA